MHAPGVLPRSAVMTAALLIGALLVAPRAEAQDARTDSTVHGVGAVVTRARAMIDRGEGSAARLLLDSLVRAQDTGSDELAESLYWRAVLAENASEAERDWHRLVVEATLSPRVPDALLWLGELELVRGHVATARASFQRLLRDFPDAPQRPRAELWIARSYIDEGNRTVGCARANALRSSVAEGELRLQADELMSRCAAFDEAAAIAATNAANAASPAAAAPAAAPKDREAPAPAASDRKSGRFTVQLAAFNTKREAESAVKRLARANVTARIEGTRKPFRVQAGRYATRAEATKALALLRKRGQKGFVTDASK